ncbi:hypothetical protein PVAR5_4023 [Paecilomyces variotii No. 5]|uniref:Acyltransferase 3 domain-containing protein n=1 Tax=Byssochlamys spectabilis (strain No. 5 / NBRC 109023) TaxID=1356009 RepID=V5HZD5_BYSSN|nr:hypothetical protein PVAR5_4023 [Paecilomyces variotii No. 5]
MIKIHHLKAVISVELAVFLIMRERIIWLDGLRGIASTIVALFHARSFEPASAVGFVFNSYWDEPGVENRRFIQLPPIRLMVAGESMVPLFMVISGYAISLPLLQLRDDVLNKHTGNADLFRRLSSGATRRFFRIYLPCMMIISVSQLFYFFGVYQWDVPNGNWVWGLKPFTAPLMHIRYALWHALHLLDISNHGIEINFLRNRPDYANLNFQLWTIPVEFRGSCMVYLLTLTMAFWRPGPRYITLLGLSSYWLCAGQWDLFSFSAGMLLAEGHITKHFEPENRSKLRHNCMVHLPSFTTGIWRYWPWYLVILGLAAYGLFIGQSDLPAYAIGILLMGWHIVPYSELEGEKGSPCHCGEACKTWSKASTKATVFIRIFKPVASFVMGIYLLCMCHSENVSPEYRFLLAIKPAGWNHAEMFQRCWRSIGAALTVYAICELPLLQTALKSKPV